MKKKKKKKHLCWLPLIHQINSDILGLVYLPVVLISVVLLVFAKRPLSHQLISTLPTHTFLKMN